MFMVAMDEYVKACWGPCYWSLKYKQNNFLWSFLKTCTYLRWSAHLPSSSNLNFNIISSNWDSVALKSCQIKLHRLLWKFEFYNLDIQRAVLALICSIAPAEFNFSTKKYHKNIVTISCFTLISCRHIWETLQWYWILLSKIL